MDYLHWLRWPTGPMCPSCGRTATTVAGDRVWRCGGCRRRVSAVASRSPFRSSRLATVLPEPTLLAIADPISPPPTTTRTSRLMLPPLGCAQKLREHVRRGGQGADFVHHPAGGAPVTGSGEDLARRGAGRGGGSMVRAAPRRTARAALSGWSARRAGMTNDTAAARALSIVPSHRQKRPG
ncbi:transposase [Lapillicoccus sp.]|uniref:transposase n=1 Tax=Lapillicoccus sp. TaxID=1909287 RepID=UPI0039831D22